MAAAHRANHHDAKQDWPPGEPQRAERRDEHGADDESEWEEPLTELSAKMGQERVHKGSTGRGRVTLDGVVGCVQCAMSGAKASLPL